MGGKGGVWRKVRYGRFESQLIVPISENKELMEKINEHNQNLLERSDVANDGMNGRDGLSGNPAERTSCYNGIPKLDCLVKRKNRNTINKK